MGNIKQKIEIIKPQNDTRNFKVITLENGIKCILIQDILLDKSYVISSINTGSLADKQYYQGIAHLLEHMCFITSKKYKETNYLEKKVNEFGGDTNAFTAAEFTVYYLNVYHNYLDNILDIFVDFLYNAELKEDYIYNEIKNVDSEHQKNMSNDEWRFYNLKHMLANKKSNYHGFFTGSKKTLNKKDIQEKIMDFYKKYYLPDNICISIISNKSIDDLTKIANDKLNKIKSENKTINHITYNKFFYKNVRKKAFCMNSLGFINTINYLFETKNTKNYLHTKIFDVLSHLLNSPKVNNINDYLLNLGYIYYLSSIYDEDGVFQIKISLTNKGLKNLDKIDGYLRYTLNYYFNQNWTNIIKYYKKQYNFIFNNLEKHDTLDLGIILTQNLAIYEQEQIYSGNYLINKEYSNKKIINIFKKYINFDKCLQIIVKHNFNENNMIIDPNYKTEYKQVNFIESIPLEFNIDLDLNNPYLDTKPIYIKDLSNNIPVLIKNNIWFGNTSNFIEPHIYCKIMFNCENYFKTPHNMLLTNISILIFNYIYDKELNKAFDLNYNVNLSSSNEINSIILNLFIYNDPNKMQIFIDNVIDILFNKIIISNKLIKIFISALKKKIRNIKNLNAYEYTNYCKTLFYSNSYKYSILLKEIKKINVSMIKKYLLTIFNNNKINCTIFLFGNIKSCPNFNKLDNFLNNNNYIKPKLNFKNINTINPNKNDNNNCIEILYYISNFNPLINLQLIFIALIFSSIFYNDLRTAQQIGYIVLFNLTNIDDNYFIFQKIQSNIESNELEKKINIFNKTINDELLKINLETLFTTVTSFLEEKETNMNELFIKYSKEIISRKFLFNRNKLLLEQLHNITIESLIDFCNKYIINNNNKYIIKVSCK